MSADIVRLVLVEALLFGHTALAMIGQSLVIALLLVGGWLFTGAELVMALASLQAFSLTGALLTVALAHLVLALAFWRLRHITPDLTYRESRASVNSLLTHARSRVDAAGRRPWAMPSKMPPTAVEPLTLPKFEFEPTTTQRMCVGHRTDQIPPAT